MSEALNTIALGIQYDGRPYNGWQKQRSQSVSTVQAQLEAALSFVANHKVSVVCAGRTDTGVHASSQVVSFQTPSVRRDSAWVRGVNGRLPETISVAWMKSVPDDFHARFSALSRRYQYFIYNTSAKSALSGGRITHQPRCLDSDLMHQASQFLLGKHDFSAFRGANCQSHSALRIVSDLRVDRFGDIVRIDISANAFLLHMVRNITGSLMEIGMGNKPVDWMGELLQGKDRRKAGMTAAPDGLYLVGVGYSEALDLPSAAPLSLLV